MFDYNDRAKAFRNTSSCIVFMKIPINIQKYFSIKYQRHIDALKVEPSTKLNCYCKTIRLLLVMTSIIDYVSMDIIH